MKQIQIVVLQRGWIVVGLVSRDNEELLIENGYAIRRWGTSAGLGELAQKGPLANTKLDPLSGKTRVHQLAVVLRIECDAENWKKYVNSDG